MGMTMEKISFMIMDKTPIEVISASRLSDFNKKTLQDFCNESWRMWKTSHKNNYIFERLNGEFVDFNCPPV